MGVGFKRLLVVGAQVQRPTAKERLIEKQFITGRRHLVIVAQRAGEGVPETDLFDVPFTALTQDGQARAGIFAALVIVGRGGEQVVGKQLQTLAVGFMEIGHRRTELLGAEAHVIS
ncbi:hypothetical protein D3C84_760400 [compost metagenome]